MKPPLLEDVAGSILDGTAVDWASVDSGTEQSDQPVIAQLKTLAALRLVVRNDATATHWGHLRVLERIGQGAFGEVFRAWDTRLDREVALKLLPAEPLKGRPKGRPLPGTESEGRPLPAEGRPLPASIIEEGRLLARVRHPNVVTIYGAERIDGRIGLWMELVNGRTLDQALRTGTKFSPADVARIGVELCQAVAAVHAAGLLHRDIKAQNVMMTGEGRLVLMDFGTGRELDGAADARVAGTPLYLAPEVLGGGATTAHSDIYSVGVVLYHLLTGSYPVEGSDLRDLRRAHGERRRTDLRDPNRAIPQPLRRVLARALDPSPDRRYASADSFSAALSALERPSTSRRTVYSGAAAIAVIAVAAGLWTQRDSFLAKSPAATTAAAVAPVTAPVIVVLPFKNLSSEPDSDYFADGLTSEVIRNLDLIEGLEVKSQTSSFWFKDRPRNLAMIGEQLGVNLIVEADVLRVGNRLRINAQLVQIAGDVPIWSERFDRTLDDVFAIQDEISRSIVNKLRLTLGRGQRRYRTNLQAYELYLRARAVRPGRSEGRGTEEAEKLFKQVIAIDPAFAPAYAGLAGLTQSMGWNVLTGESPGIRSAALKALELDPLLAEAHVAMGITYTYEHDWENATKSFERALELNPNLTQIHTAYSDALVLMGQKERALTLLEQALIMDPLSLTVRRDLAFAQFLNGRFEDAIANARQVVAADPEFNADLMLARALTLAGRPEEAIAVWNSEPENRMWERWLVRAYVMTGRKKELGRVVAAHRNAEPYHQAIVYAALGDKDRTFDALNRAADRGDRRAPAFVYSPETEFLRGDPRLDALTKKLKLPVE